MDALPRDVLVQILSQLPVQDVISISQVSRGMLEASQDDRVWVRREEWRSWMISVPQRAVGKWVGTVLGLPWQVIARCMRIRSEGPSDRNDVIHEDANPNLTRRCILPCSVWVDFTRHGGPLGAVELSRLRMVTNDRVCQEILKDRTKDPDAAKEALREFLVDVFKESGLPHSHEMPSPKDEYDNEYDSDFQCGYDSDGEVVTDGWDDYEWRFRTEERPPPRKQGYKGFGFRDFACFGMMDGLILELTPRILVCAALMTRMDATLFDDASDGAISSTPPWSRKFEETRKDNLGVDVLGLAGVAPPPTRKRSGRCSGLASWVSR